ncbi:MAG TPA: hypothetical protein VLF19_04180 [Methylomirabilota bacterium]|nr:hypothetical protein [Methylomirabilota bacterium]
MSLRPAARWARAFGLVVVALLSAPNGPALAHSFLSKNFDQLVVEAEEIFVGTLTAASSSRLATGTIVTDLTFSGVQVVKGHSSSDVRTVRILGGTVGDLTLKIMGTPDFDRGRTYLLFSKENGRAILPFVGGAQGVFRVVPDATTGTELIVDARGHPMVGSFGGAPGRGVAASRDGSGRPVVSLDVFIQAIRDRLPR